MCGGRLSVKRATYTRYNTRYMTATSCARLACAVKRDLHDVIVARWGWWTLGGPWPGTGHLARLRWAELGRLVTEAAGRWWIEWRAIRVFVVRCTQAAVLTVTPSAHDVRTSPQSSPRHARVVCYSCTTGRRDVTQCLFVVLRASV